MGDKPISFYREKGHTAFVRYLKDNGISISSTQVLFRPTFTNEGIDVDKVHYQFLLHRRPTGVEKFRRFGFFVTFRFSSSQNDRDRSLTEHGTNDALAKFRAELWSVAENGKTFEDWAMNHKRDVDSRFAELEYRLLRFELARFHDFMNDDLTNLFYDFMYKVESPEQSF